MANLTEDRVWGHILECSYDAAKPNFVGADVLDSLRKKENAPDCFLCSSSLIQATFRYTIRDSADVAPDLHSELRPHRPH